MANNRPEQMHVNLELPADLEAVYSNFALITHSASEIIIDFAQMLPNNPKAKVQARVVSTPLHAKLLLRALQENLDKYEAQFGEIKLPSDGDALAQQFFGGTRPPAPPQE
jgi:hypothetical protein